MPSPPARHQYVTDTVRAKHAQKKGMMIFRTARYQQLLELCESRLIRVYWSVGTTALVLV